MTSKNLLAAQSQGSFKAFFTILLASALLIIAVVTLAAPAPTTANLWIDANGGSCQRQPTAASYVDAQACGSFDAAYEAASLGDVVVIKNNAYPAQDMNGPAKGSGAQITFIGESDTGVTVKVLGLANVSRVTFQDFTLTDPTYSGAPTNKMLDIRDSTSIILDNVDLNRNYKEADGAHLGGNINGFTWKNSDVCCNAEWKLIMMHPYYSSPSVTNALFENMDVHDQVYTATSYSGEPPHAECWWLQDANGLTLRNVRTYDCISTGAMNWGGTGNTKNLLFSNTIWGKKYTYTNGVDVIPGPQVGYRGDSGNTLIDGANTSGTGIIENSVFEGVIVDNGWSSLTYRNNIGEKGGNWACTAGPIYIKNIWTNAKCSTTADNNPVGDILTNPNYYVSRSSSDWRPKAGAPQIDKGDTNNFSPTDFLGNIRPFGAAPDVGPYEFGAGSGPSDTNPPTNVTVTAPTAGATLVGNATLTATAQDDVGVAGIQFKVDGNNVESEDTGSPFSVSWDSTGVANGSHTITATARDAAGNTTTSSGVTVTVNNPTAPADTLLLGNQAVESFSDPIGSGQIEAWPFTAVASGTAGKIAINLAAAPSQLEVGVYSDSGGNPTNLLAKATISSPTTGWNIATLNASPNIASGTPYWIAALNTGSGQMTVRDHPSGGSCLAKVNLAPNNKTTLGSTFGQVAVDNSLTQCPVSAYVTAASSSSVRPADVNEDGTINIFDLSILLSNYGRTSSSWTNARADVNNNGTVDIFDLSTLLSGYGT